jgi:hypothetical protein
MLQVIFAEGRSRPGRLAAFTTGLEELAGIAARFPPERVSAATGIAAGEIRRLARELAEAPAAAPYGRVGACTQRFGGLTTWLLDALAIATGNLDREGGLLFARPAFDLVALGSRFRVPPAEIGRHRTRVRGLPSFGGQLPAIALAEEIDTPGRGRLRALLTIAGNPVLSLPDGGRLERALGGGLDLMVAIDLYLNETTRFADFILPAAQALEQDHYDLALHLLTVRNTARYSPPLFAPSPGSPAVSTAATAALAASAGSAPASSGGSSKGSGPPVSSTSACASGLTATASCPGRAASRWHGSGRLPTASTSARYSRACPRCSTPGPSISCRSPSAVTSTGSRRCSPSRSSPAASNLSAGAICATTTPGSTTARASSPAATAAPC